MDLNYLRQFKIGPFTLFDTVLAFVGMFLIAPLLTHIVSKTFHYHVPRHAWMWLTVPIAILFHILFHQNTPLTRMFLDMQGYVFEKIAVVLFVYMGVKDIRRISVEKHNSIQTPRHRQ